ncbi:type II secretion system protein GspG [Candidatus Dependentiae bacterium]|nr:type II secretion system protein GspG [Candidatus Dependentiae bacterium]
MQLSIKRCNDGQLQQGFSFIELMIVVAIMAALALILGPRLMEGLRESRESATKATLSGIKQAIMIYQSQVMQLPTTLRDLVRKPSDPRAAAKWRGPYLDGEDTPRDAWDNEIQYRKNAGNTVKPFELYSFGANGPGSASNEWIKA